MAKRQRHDPTLSSPPTNPTIFPHTNDSSDSDAPSTTNSKKYNRLDPKLSHNRPRTPPVVSCNFLPNCNQRPFSSYAEFESHYQQEHTNRCHECHRNFPSERYLVIHISENHDVFNELKKEKGEKTFQCFVEGCERLCSTPQKRRLHVIDKHGFPKDFYFRVVDYGIDNCSSLLRTPRRYSNSSLGQNGSTVNTSMLSPPESPKTVRTDNKDTVSEEIEESKELEMEDEEKPEESEKTDTAPVEITPAVTKKYRRVRQSENVQKGGDPDKDMQDVTDLMASVKLVPRQVRFGRGGGMVGFGSRR